MKFRFAFIASVFCLSIAASCSSTKKLTMCDCIKAQADEDSEIMSKCIEKFDVSKYSAEEQEELKKEAIRCAEAFGIDAHKEKQNATLEVK